MSGVFRPVVLVASILATVACGGGGDVVDPSSGGGPGTGPGQSQVVVGTFFSSALGVSKQYLVYLPPSYATNPTRRYPVAYYLHGSGDNERSWIHDTYTWQNSTGQQVLDSLKLDVILDSLVALGNPEAIVVMPDGDNSWYHNWATSYNYNACLQGAEETPAQWYCVQHMQYSTYMAQDLVGHIDATYRTLADAHHRGIAGLSMGGYGALYLGLARPDLFGAIASLSGARPSLLYAGTYPNVYQAADTAELHPQYVSSAGDQFQFFINQFGTSLSNWRLYDPYSLVTNLVSAHGVQGVPHLWFIDGSGDRPQDLLIPNRIFDRQLTQLGVPHYYAEPPGGHTRAFWAAHEGEATAWLLSQIGQ